MLSDDLGVSDEADVAFLAFFCFVLFLCFEKQTPAMDSDSWKTPSLTPHMLLESDCCAFLPCSKVNGNPQSYAKGDRKQL